ncbi:Zn-ribbon domain-containing OB-fold protein [Yinghuangia soli]|uniref:OB-fold domain-containing protein n=1 Tax=Yinghuangia soli TaxID=2908204 RepID=A0AA41U1K2_9ACTN|nr:OB-fold domain-containing protein [Yinghuangia soli]MCF2530863.1 OB-fold domain-containing protein [Yinghuangia soli]
MDRDSTEWWASLAAHALIFQRCSECQTWRWPARAMCHACGAFAWRWQPASGRGEVASWIVNHHVFLPGVPAPYVVLNVRMAEQPDLVLPGAFEGPYDDPRLVIGAQVEAGFADCPGDPPAALLRWRIIQSIA